MRRLRPPAWLRRAIEAAVIGGGVATVSLLGLGLGVGPAGGPGMALPAGAGILLLAPATVAIAVIPISYPVAMAATRADAVLGALAAFLLAADASLILAPAPVFLPRTGMEAGAGLLTAVIAVLPALLGLIGGQLATPLGFGRRAGAWTALVAVICCGLTLAGLAVVA
jgi:hypothetical protein